MPMNRAERAEMEALRTRDAVLRAVSYPSFPRPVPMSECPSGQIQKGWAINPSAGLNAILAGVYLLWRDSTRTYGVDPRRFKVANKPIGFRRVSKIYATEQDAYRALAYALADQFGAAMAKVYARCF